MARDVDEVRGDLLGWAIANVLGFGVLGAISLVASSIPLLSGMFMSALVVGIPVGLAQWIAMRRLAQVSIAWVLSVSIGLLMALLTLEVMPDGLVGFADDESVSVLVLSFTFIGLLVGTVQWLLLRSQFSRALVWLLASSVGTGVAFWLVLGTGLINESGLVAAIVVVLAYTGVTGLALIWLRGQQANNLSRLPNAT